LHRIIVNYQYARHVFLWEPVITSSGTWRFESRCAVLEQTRRARLTGF
jgi:hypothetical protein